MNPSVLVISNSLTPVGKWLLGELGRQPGEVNAIRPTRSRAFVRGFREGLLI